MANPFPLKLGQQTINVIANPAVATGFTYSPSVRRIEQLESIHYIMTTDANAANRRLFFEVDDGTNVIATFATDFAVIVNIVAQQSWNVNAGTVVDVTTGSSWFTTQFLPPDFILPLAATLTQIITNVQAGDQVSAIIVVTKTWART